MSTTSPFLPTNVVLLAMSLSGLIGGCASKPQAGALPSQLSQIDAGMSRAMVREICGDDGSLSFRCQFAQEIFEVRSLTIQGTARAYALLFQNQQLVAIVSENSGGMNALAEWWRQSLPFPMEHDGKSLSDKLFSADAVPFHSDFRKIDQQAKDEHSQVPNETSGMIIALTWWNPVAWIATPIFLTGMANQAAKEDAFYHRLDGIRIGANESEIVAALGKPDAEILRPDNVTYCIYGRSIFLATVALRNGAACGVYPHCDVRQDRIGIGTN